MRKIVEKSMLGNAWTVLNELEDGKISTDTQTLIKNILKGRGIEGDEKLKNFYIHILKIICQTHLY